MILYFDDRNHDSTAHPRVRSRYACDGCGSRTFHGVLIESWKRATPLKLCPGCAREVWELHRVCEHCGEPFLAAHEDEVQVCDGCPCGVTESEAWYWDDTCGWVCHACGRPINPADGDPGCMCEEMER